MYLLSTSPPPDLYTNWSPLTSTELISTVLTEDSDELLLKMRLLLLSEFNEDKSLKSPTPPPKKVYE